ncbi:hypothetical protein [Kaarinaea lacus]
MNLQHHSTISCSTAWNKVFACAQRFPGIYSLLLIPLALLGFLYLLSFPALFLASAVKLIQLFSKTPPGQLATHLDTIVIWAGIMSLSALTTRQIMKLKFSPIEGITISQPTASKLHSLLNQINGQINAPGIDRIIITEQLSLDIVKTPVYPLPIWSINTLVVGLPLMQCLSPDYFKCAMVRKLIQHSKHKHVLPKWIAQLRNIWVQYLKVTSLKSNKLNILLYAFFKFYAPFYKFISIPVANHVELISDQDTLSVINDEDLLQTIEKIVLTKIYLEKQYWPRIKNMINHNRYTLIEPYSKLEQVLRAGLTPQLSKRWLDSLYCHRSTQLSPIPDLRSRMNNIGRSKIRIPEKVQETAAHYFLDNAYGDIISEFNQLWLMRSNNLYDNSGASTQSVKLQADRQLSFHGSISRMNTNLFN